MHKSHNNMAAPRVGNLEQLIQIFTYLKHQQKQKIYMDPELPKVSENLFEVFSWQDFYCDAIILRSKREPVMRGNAVIIRCFVESNDAGNFVTRRSQSGIIIFVNKGPVIWFNKK